MISSITKKRLAGALAVLSLSLLTLGCDDDHDRDRHHRPTRHTEQRDHERHDHDRHRDRDHHQNGENRDHRGDRQNHRDHDRNRRNDRDDNNQYRRRHSSAFVGAYSARALNDAVTAKGTTFYLDVVQNEDASLALVLPSGKQYPIRFDAETGTGAVAGGSLSLREDGIFLYQDAKGGLWLIERK